MLQKRRRLVAPLILALSIGVGACSAQSPAPQTPPRPTTAPAAASVPTKGATVSPRIDVSPLQPGVATSPLQPAVAQTYVPISAEACEALRDSVESALQADAQSETASFRDYVTGVLGQACAINVRGTGVDFASSPEVAQQLQELFTSQGWILDAAYAADSPTGTLFGLRKNSQLALIDVGWIAAAGVTCPQDQPISACDIKPEQKNYVITVNVAQGQ